MRKGYIDFETFKQQNAKFKTPQLKCPKCKKPMEFSITDKYGNNMCPNCFAEVVAKRKKPKEVPIEEDKYEEYNQELL